MEDLAIADSWRELMWHPSDLAVKPIIGNRRIEKLPEPRYASCLILVGCLVVPLPPYLLHTAAAQCRAAEATDRSPFSAYGH